MRKGAFRSKLVQAAALGAACLLTTATAVAQNNRPKVTWHWHMHQPIYWNDQLRTGAVDRYEYAWDSIQQKDGGAGYPQNDLRNIFGIADRVAAYQYRTRDSLALIGGANPNSGAAMSYSGALMENVKSLGDAGQLEYNSGWKGAMQQANGWTTASGAKRLDFTNFSHHHALLGLLDKDTVYMEVRLNQEMISREFGSGAVTKGFFPTEMCYSTRLIPVLKQLGIEWSIVSGEHIARACPDFPLQFGSGGVNCAPPNKADQINPNGEQFIRVSIDRGCSPVAANPLSYQPAYSQWVNPDTGAIEKILVVPADQSQGWKDGYSCLGADFLANLEARNNTGIPSMVVLSHDGDNAFGGGYSYYNECVPNLANGAKTRGNEVVTIQDYVNRYKNNITQTIHVEDGGWVNADGDFGSPTYINWNYPLLDASGRLDPVNGWHEKPREMAIFTATVNRVLTAQQISGHAPVFSKILQPDGATHAVDRAWHYYLGSLDSGNVYYGDVLDLEVKGTLGCNEAIQHTDPIIGTGTGDLTPPTIWLPQRSPYNPGSVNYGVEHQYRQVIDDGDFHIWTFIYDVSGPATAVLKYRIDGDGTNPLASTQNETFAGGAEVGSWVSLPMTRRTFPAGNIYNKGGLNYFEMPTYIADHYVVEVTGIRSSLLDYYIESTDTKGNVAKSPIQHVWVGDGQGSTPGGSRVTLEPNPPKRGESCTVTYDATGTTLDAASQVYIHRGKNSWQSVVSPRPAMTSIGSKKWTDTYTIDADATTVEMVFTTTATGGTGLWDNNGGADWRFTTAAGTGGPTATPSPSPTVSPSPAAGQNPFLMDGTLDASACNIGNNFYVAESNGWLYVAMTGSQPNDNFIYVSSNATPLQAVNWGKAGQVGRWDYFLAMEGSNNYSSWYSAAGSELANVTGSYVQTRNGTFVEGAIRKDLIGGATTYTAMGAFQTDNAGANGLGALVLQSPAAVGTVNGSIETAEFLTVTTGVNFCPGATPTPTASATPSPSPTGPTPTISPSATATPTPSPSPSPSPTPFVGSRITIGQGPVKGTTAGQTFYEEFQDWQHEDCRSVDPVGDEYEFNANPDTDAARDLVAFYTYDDPTGGNFYMRADLDDLSLGAETAELDVMVMLDFGTPSSGQVFWPDFLDAQTDHRWEVAIVVDTVGDWRVYDSAFNIITNASTSPTLWRGTYMRSDLDAIEFGIARSVLTSAGWDGSSPISIQVGTARDGVEIGTGTQSDLTDCIPDPDRGFSDGIVNGAILTDGSCPTAKFAFILHGNQAISDAKSIQDLVYNTTVTTPAGNPTGYHRALDTARIFGVSPNIHVSATLVASALWADKPGTADPQDGAEFVKYIARFLDGNTSNGEGAIVWGVFSEHIMPFFEGQVNQDSIQLNEDYLQDVLGIGPPTGDSAFWIPERVCRGTTFNDLVQTGYGYTILDQINHLRTWYGSGAEASGKHKINQINGVKAFMINDEPDRFKFANTDGGLWLDTRHLLAAKALDVDQQQLVLVFDDWEAYAGRSFLSFDQGTDNPDNFNRNIRWIANHPWIQVVKLEDVASWNWTPVDRGNNSNLAFETYDFLDFATEGNYQTWYHGSALEEDFDDYQPWIRQDLSSRGTKKFGGLTSYVSSTSGAFGGPGSIAEDVRSQTFLAPANGLQKLARLGFSTAIFETAWHDEDSAVRCGDSTYCNPDTTFNNIAAFARQLQFLNLRRTRILSLAAEWAAAPPASVTVLQTDVDHDGEQEYVLKNDRVFAVLENDGGRLIAGFARNPTTGQVASLIGNLLGFPDGDDEIEASANANGRRLSGLSDWWAAGPNTSQYVNGIYTVTPLANGFTFTSAGSQIAKTVTLAASSSTIDVDYTLNPAVTTLYVRNGLSPDILDLLRSGQAALSATNTGGRYTLTNSNTGASVSIDYADAGHNATFNAAASDGTANTPRNMAQLHMTELSGSGTFSFGLTLTAGTDPTPTPSPTPSPSISPTAIPSATASLSPSPTSSLSPSPSATVAPTASVSPTASATPSATASPTASATASLTATETATPTASATATASPTVSATATASATPTASTTATSTATATASPTGSTTATATATPSASPTASPTVSPSPSPSPSLTPSPSPTPFPTPNGLRDRIVRYLAGLDEYDAAFDVNSDGIVDAADVVAAPN